jgi:hypothetical protein
VLPLASHNDSVIFRKFIDVMTAEISLSNHCCSTTNTPFYTTAAMSSLPRATEDAIAKYKKSLEDAKVVVFRHFPPTVSTPDTTLECWQIDPEHKPTGFTCSTTLKDQQAGVLPKYQYRFEGSKMTAWHVPFIDTRRDPRMKEHTWTLSHLCHNPSCYNWNHHTMESLAVNKGRNGCAGGTMCAHRRAPCLIRGPDIE